MLKIDEMPIIFNSKRTGINCNDTDDYPGIMMGNYLAPVNIENTEVSADFQTDSALATFIKRAAAIIVWIYVIWVTAKY